MNIVILQKCFQVNMSCLNIRIRSLLTEMAKYLSCLLLIYGIMKKSFNLTMTIQNNCLKRNLDFGNLIKVVNIFKHSKTSSNNNLKPTTRKFSKSGKNQVRLNSISCYQNQLQMKILRLKKNIILKVIIMQGRWMKMGGLMELVGISERMGL